MLTWGGGAIRKPDWEVLQEVIEKFDVKTVLEFGAGYSTVLLNSRVDVTTYETNPLWEKRVKQELPTAKILLWDGKDAEAIRSDMVFIDGPAGGQNREHSFRIGVESSDLIAVHDSGREWEEKWIAKYLRNFKQVLGNGVTTVWKKEGDMSRKVTLEVSEDIVRNLENSQNEGRWFLAISYIDKQGKRISQCQTRQFPHADIIPAIRDWEKKIREKEGENIPSVVEMPEKESGEWK